MPYDTFGISQRQGPLLVHKESKGRIMTKTTTARMRPSQQQPTTTRTKQQQQQSILGFFDVPDFANVAVQRKTKDNNKKRKNSNTSQQHNKTTTSNTGNPKRIKTDSSILPQSNSRNISNNNNNNNNDSNNVALDCKAQPSHINNNNEGKQQTDSTSSDNDDKSDHQAAAFEIDSVTRQVQATLCITTRSTPRNLVFQLQQRSTLGLTCRSRVIAQPAPRMIPWSLASWLKLACPRSGRVLSDAACLLEWDTLGILLAVMVPNDAILRIYDWDTVCVAHAKGRNHRVRRKANPALVHSGGSFLIETTLATNVRICGRQVRKLAWNPFDPDQIVVLDCNFLYIFDLAREAARQQSRQSGAAAKPTKVELPFGRRHLVMNLYFCAADTMIVSAGDQIVCVSLRKSTRRNDGVIVPCLLWSFSWKNNIVSCIAKFDASRVVLGSQQGFLSVVNWKHSQKVAFATVARPTIQCSWLSCNGVRHPGSSQMGIHHLSIQQQEQVNELDGDGKKMFGDARATWVTSCGWVMATDIDLIEGKPVRTPTVLHRTNPVKCMNHRNEYIDMGKNVGWSLPSQEIRMTGTESCLCWERVPAVVQQLPDHDKFVLHDRPRQSTIPAQPSLHVLSRQTGQVHNLQLGKGKNTVTTVAMHTNQEWILVATKENGVRFYNARKKIAY